MLEQREREIRQFSENLGYAFDNLKLLDLALSHSSWSNERMCSQPALVCNERLEFLGDAVLGMVISDYLYKNFSQAPEGELSRMRANLVNTQALAACARELNIGDYLLLGKGEEQQEGRQKVSILADALEAVLAAVYLDGGMEAVYRVIERIFAARITMPSQDVAHKDHKSALQEKVQAIMPSHPQYKLLSATGPDHQRMFQVAVMLQGKTLATAKGSSKKKAEQAAALLVLENFEMLQEDDCEG